MIAIIGAMDSEIEEFLKHSSNVKENSWGDFTFHTAELMNQAIVISKSGVGKVVSAMVTQKIVDLFQPKAIIFTGIAGALAEDLDIGDIIVSRDCIQHDLDLSPLGFERGQIAYTNYRIINADPSLTSKALSFSHDGCTIRLGRILTGDQFFTASHLDDYRSVLDELGGDVIEMEGASVGTVAMFNNIPFVIIRTVSDKANHEAHIDFNNFLPIASKNSFLITKHILKEYNHQ